MLDVFIHTKIIVHFYNLFYLLSHFSLHFFKYAPYIDLNILIGRTDAMSLLLNIEGWNNSIALLKLDFVTRL